VPEDAVVGMAEGIIEANSDSHHSVLILSAAGASGVSTDVITDGRDSADGVSAPTTTSAYALKPDSNTNLAQPRTLIPVVARDVARDLAAGDYIYAVTSIFAVSADANGGREASTRRSLQERWADKPVISIRADENVTGDCIRVILEQ
jgi:hypothetical protein